MKIEGSQIRSIRFTTSADTVNAATVNDALFTTWAAENPNTIIIDIQDNEIGYFNNGAGVVYNVTKIIYYYNL